jgi:sarcosine oxidase
VKVALHAPGRAADPDGVSRDVTEDDIAPLREFLTHALPAASGPLLSAKVCLYTNSPDHHFILGAHPRHPNVVLAAGFSGHGFKFAPVIGEALAGLALGGETKLPVAFLSPKRFSSGVPL